MNVYDWVSSYTPLKREYTTSRPASKRNKSFPSKKQSRINILTVCQITEFEKTKIQSISSAKITVTDLEEGTFKTEELLKLLSKHHDKFT